MKKIITFLGIYPKETKYQHQGTDYRGEVFAEAMHQFLDFDEMLVFVTEAALQSAYPVLQNLNDERIHPVEIPIGETTDEMWQIFTKLTDSVDNGDTVIFDITHGLRSLPFLVFLVAAFLKSAKDVTIEAIYYGAFELNKDAQGNPRPAPVIDLSNFVDLLDWLNASDQFIRTGNATYLAEQIRQAKPNYAQQQEKPMAREQSRQMSQAANALTEVSRALRLILPDQAMSASETLQTTLGSAASALNEYAQPFSVLAQQVIDAYSPIALNAPRNQANSVASMNRERLLIQWYLDRNQLVQAIAIAREWLVSWGVLQADCHDLYNREYRQEVESAFGRANDQRRKQSGSFDDYTFTSGKRLREFASLKSALTLYEQLGDLRNTLLHAGKRPSTEPAETLEKKVKNLCQQLQQLPLPIEIQNSEATP